MNSILGMDKLMAQLYEIANLDMEKVLLAGGQPILQEMQSLTPVDKGDLLVSEGMEAHGNELEIYAGTDHALPVEFGTVNMQAEPFMRPAVDTKSHEAELAMAKEAERQIRSIANG